MGRVAKLWIVAAIIILCAPTTRAEPLRLAIDDVVERAIKTNLDLQASRTDISVAEANLERSRILLPTNPIFTGGAQHTIGYAPNYSFSLSQEFEIAGQRRVRMSAAQKEVEKATWDVKAIEQVLAATAKTAFIHAMISIDRVTVARQGVDTVAELISDLERTTTPSPTQRIERNQARIQDVRNRRTLAAAEQMRQTAFDALRRLLGLPVAQEIVLAGVPQTDISQLPTEAELITRALERRPDLVALHRSVEQTDLRLALTRREGIPNVTVSGTYARFQADTLVGGDLSVPLPLFQRKGPEIHETLAESERANLQVQTLEREVAKEVREARQACILAGGDLQAQQRQIVPMSEENLAIERRLYDRGQVEVADLVGMQGDLLTARHEYLDALETYNTALIELNRVAGGSLTDE